MVSKYYGKPPPGGSIGRKIRCLGYVCLSFPAYIYQEKKCSLVLVFVKAQKPQIDKLLIIGAIETTLEVLMRVCACWQVS